MPPLTSGIPSVPYISILNGNVLCCKPSVCCYRHLTVSENTVLFFIQFLYLFLQSSMTGYPILFTDLSLSFSSVQMIFYCIFFQLCGMLLVLVIAFENKITPLVQSRIFVVRVSALRGLYQKQRFLFLIYTKAQNRSKHLYSVPPLTYYCFMPSSIALILASIR